MTGAVHCDLLVIGGGPAGAAAAIRAARGGAKVVLFEKGPVGRDKVCGDGLTPRAIAALAALGIGIPGGERTHPRTLAGAHRIDGLRMIAGPARKRVIRELPWPSDGPYPGYGAVLPRAQLDAQLLAAAADEGVEIRNSEEALPDLDSGRVIGAQTSSGTWRAPFTVLAAGAAGAAARLVGAERVPAETFGLAIRAYVESPRHCERHLEACLSLVDEAGQAVPGYGWMFPAGDGTVNIGVGALSTMKGFRKLNLNTLLDSYARSVAPTWRSGGYLAKPRAWRLPMTVVRRHGPGWVAAGDAAGLVNPMNGEGIDYALESGTLAADLFLKDPASAAVLYDEQLAARFDAFLRTGRRFSLIIGHPLLLRAGLRVAMGTEAAADVTLAVMGNLLDANSRGASGRVLRSADRVLGAADPLLRRTRAKG